MSSALIEKTLELWAASLREVKARMGRSGYFGPDWRAKLSRTENMVMAGIIETAVATIARPRRTDQDQRRACDPGRFRLLADVGERPANQHFVRPADPIGHDHRAITTVIGPQSP